MAPGCPHTRGCALSLSRVSAGGSLATGVALPSPSAMPLAAAWLPPAEAGLHLATSRCPGLSGSEDPHSPGLHSRAPNRGPAPARGPAARCERHAGRPRSSCWLGSAQLADAPSVSGAARPRALPRSGRLQGLAPPTSPLRSPPVSSSGSPYPSMGFVPLQGHPSSASVPRGASEDAACLAPRRPTRPLERPNPSCGSLSPALGEPSSSCRAAGVCPDWELRPLLLRLPGARGLLRGSGLAAADLHGVLDVKDHSEECLLGRSPVKIGRAHV